MCPQVAALPAQPSRLISPSSRSLEASRSGAWTVIPFAQLGVCNRLIKRGPLRTLARRQHLDHRISARPKKHWNGVALDAVVVDHAVFGRKIFVVAPADNEIARVHHQRSRDDIHLAPVT